MRWSNDSPTSPAENFASPDSNKRGLIRDISRADPRRGREVNGGWFGAELGGAYMVKMRAKINTVLEMKTTMKIAV